VATNYELAYPKERNRILSLIPTSQPLLERIPIALKYTEIIDNLLKKRLILPKLFSGIDNHLIEVP
jgi:hypothetical protein